jgi:hypothetical protein
MQQRGCEPVKLLMIAVETAVRFVVPAAAAAAAAAVMISAQCSSEVSV